MKKQSQDHLQGARQQQMINNGRSSSSIYELIGGHHPLAPIIGSTMLWHPTVSYTGFRSRLRDTDEASTGKWLVPIHIPDIGKLWEEIEDAACEGKLIAVKKSTDILGKKLGHNLACVYCSASDRETVQEVLAILRELGVAGELRYKSDRATHEFRSDYLWSSAEIDLTNDSVPDRPRL